MRSWVVTLTLILLAATATAIPALNLNKNAYLNKEKPARQISTDQKYSPLSKTKQPETLVLRILQDNPFSPTGDVMNTTPGVKPDDNTLTIDLINQITSQNGTSTKPNATSNSSDPLFVIGSNNSALNVSIIGQSTNNSSSIDSVLGNQSWIQVNVDGLTYNPAWISANNYLLRLNVSYYYPNQIIILLTQNTSLGTAFNVTYRSVKGFVQTLLLVNQSYLPTLLSSQILTNIQSVPVNSSTILYNVTRSLLQSLFYDFTMAPLSLQNGTETNFSGFTLYDLRYQSKNGIYSFLIKSQLLPNGSIVGSILSCNPITISVATQTVPVLASINIINVDANFKFVNQTIVNFLTKSLNLSNFTVVYNSVILWSNRAGSSILYYLNISVTQPSLNSFQTYLAGVSYNLTNRYQTLTYWRNAQPPIPALSANSTDYEEVSYLQILSNSTFMNVDLSARTNYPTIVVGPIIKIQIKRTGENKTGFRLTYYGANGKNVEAAYNP